MIETISTVLAALTILGGIVIAILRYYRWKHIKEPEFKTIYSEGTEATRYKFTGKYLAKVSYFHSEGGVRTYKLYETPSGFYRVMYPNGNVSFAKTASDVRDRHSDLARKAGLVKTIDLDERS